MQGSGIIGLIYAAVMIVVIAGGWKMFVKAGQPGWAILVPIYNCVVMLKMAGKPVWWLILFLVPLANFVVAIMLMVALAKKFSKGVGFALGMIFLGFIFIPILGFGSAQYNAAA